MLTGALNVVDAVADHDGPLRVRTTRDEAAQRLGHHIRLRAAHLIFARARDHGEVLREVVVIEHEVRHRLGLRRRERHWPPTRVHIAQEVGHARVDRRGQQPVCEVVLAVDHERSVRFSDRQPAESLESVEDGRADKRTQRLAVRHRPTHRLECVRERADDADGRVDHRAVEVNEQHVVWAVLGVMHGNPVHRDVARAGGGRAAVMTTAGPPPPRAQAHRIRVRVKRRVRR